MAHSVTTLGFLSNSFEGVVTAANLLTAIVGDLPADASEAQGDFVARADGSWLVDGSAPMEDVQERFALEALPPDEAGAYHTIGGFCMARLGRVPKTADAFDWGGLHFEVIDTQREGGFMLHLGHLRGGRLDLGATVTAEVDAERRAAIRRRWSSAVSI